MSLQILVKLLALIAVVAIGFVVGRARWLSPDERDSDPARTLSYAALYIFVPALLFRTTARIDLAALPWRMLIAFFVPVVLTMLVVYAWQRRAHRDGTLPVAGPSVRAITGCFGNTVQVGVPMAAALFGEAGLAIHITLVSLHALVLLTWQTTFVELDLARAQSRSGAAVHRLWSTLGTTVRNTVIHPVVLPVLLGLGWNLAGLPLPAVVDELLQMLGQAVVPLCLVLIGISLAYYGIGSTLRPALVLGAVKLLLIPASVLLFARHALHLTGLPLAVIVMAAALPAGSNSLIFAQRYGALQAEAGTTVLLSTLAFAVTAPLWIIVLAWLG